MSCHVAITSATINTVESVQLKNVAIRFDDFFLSNVNLTLKRGDSLVLIGPSGQGKSVILKIIAGLIEPDEGEVLVEGKNLHTMSEEERHDIVFKMGMLFQKNALFDSFSCGENIAFPLREVKKMPEKDIAERVHHYLEAVGILHAKDLFPNEISGGMQKRLGIARALALDPEIILYDDPTAGLDPITSRKIASMMMDLQSKNNSTNVTVTNDMGRAFQIATHIAMVVKGEMILTGNPQQTQQHTDPRVKQFIRGELEGPLG